jgi:thiamine biosynthesis lipoprotein
MNLRDRRDPKMHVRENGRDALLVRRARPLLGTFVEIGIDGLGEAQATRAIERAFDEIAAIHRLMSFHETGSDLDRLHRAVPGTRMRVDGRTHEVLAWSLRMAAASAGCFDPTIAVMQVAWGLLPRPGSPWSPHWQADWRDIELCGSRYVRMLRPLWIDLGGIAKGYAVDRAVEILADAGATSICVNAGGDLRVAGERALPIELRTASGPIPALELAEGALATSAGPARVHGSRQAIGPHVHGRTRQPAGARRIVSVAASRCVVADALTKVVMTGDDDISARVLTQFDAQAAILSDEAWSLLGVAA